MHAPSNPPTPSPSPSPSLHTHTHSHTHVQVQTHTHTAVFPLCSVWHSRLSRGRSPVFIHLSSTLPGSYLLHHTRCPHHCCCECVHVCLPARWWMQTDVTVTGCTLSVLMIVWLVIVRLVTHAWVEEKGCLFGIDFQFNFVLYIILICRYLVLKWLHNYNIDVFSINTLTINYILDS